jgi:hypothetical protein
MIEKPWAVYGTYLGASGIGKIVSFSEDQKQAYIQESEKSDWNLMEREVISIQSFRTSQEAIDYFFETQYSLNRRKYSQKEIVQIVVENFPISVKHEPLFFAHYLLILNKREEDN